MSIRTPITFASLKEKRQIEKLAEKAKLSLSNYVRQALGLDPLTAGGQRPGAGRPSKLDQRQYELLNDIELYMKAAYALFGTGPQAGIVFEEEDPGPNSIIANIVIAHAKDNSKPPV